MVVTFGVLKQEDSRRPIAISGFSGVRLLSCGAAATEGSSFKEDSAERSPRSSQSVSKGLNRKRSSYKNNVNR